MKATVVLTDWYNENITCNVRVEPIELGDHPVYNRTHYAVLTEGQIRKVRRELPNGCRMMEETRQDNMTGGIVEAVVYFDLDSTKKGEWEHGKA